MSSYVQTVNASSLGEGPHWNAAKQEFYYVDITGKAVHRYVPETGEHTQVRIDQDEVALVVPVESQENMYVVAVGRSLQLMNWDGKSSTPTSLTSMFTVSNLFNDGKCDALGRLWAGTMSDNNVTGSLYRVTNNSIQEVQSAAISNGIAWNSDNTLMYYIDSATDRVDVFDFNLEYGTINNRRTVYDFRAVGEKGSPDGMNIDADNNLWVACWGGAQVIHLDGSTGQKINAIPMPTNNITSIAFGGPNLDVMYVTSASDGLSQEQKLEQPTAGSLFQITNTGAKGRSGGNNFKL